MPATYIRLDVSHFIAMVSRWKCLKTKVHAARRLYLRCMAQAYQMSDFKTLSYFLESVLAVALSEYLGTSKEGIVVPAQIRMEVLDRTIEGVAFTDLMQMITKLLRTRIAIMTFWKTMLLIGRHELIQSTLPLKTLEVHPKKEP